MQSATESDWRPVPCADCELPIRCTRPALTLCSPGTRSERRLSASLPQTAESTAVKGHRLGGTFRSGPALVPCAGPVSGGAGIGIPALPPRSPEVLRNVIPQDEGRAADRPYTSAARAQSSSLGLSQTPRRPAIKKSRRRGDLSTKGGGRPVRLLPGPKTTKSPRPFRYAGFDVRCEAFLYRLTRFNGGSGTFPSPSRRWRRPPRWPKKSMRLSLCAADSPGRWIVSRRGSSAPARAAPPPWSDR
jgi:hypothetical protein